jgi:N-carbamoyl-L-amino-acid hydrolase
MSNHLSIDGERLWRMLELSAGIGTWRALGLRRLALTDEDKLIREIVVGWGREAGCTVEIDCVGNIFARRPGSEPSLPPVCVGSHLDTQISGGRYDGVLGVLCGLEAIQSLNDQGIKTRRPIELVVWTNEEGARFTPSMAGSGVFSGMVALDSVLASRDSNGKVFGEELARIGYAGSLPPKSRTFDAYFELHIEQGPILDRENIDIGIVTGGYRACGYDLELTGETGHPGPTPMEFRRNAAVGAARIIAAVDDIGWKYASEDAKSATTHVSCWPGLQGIIPESARVDLDFRHPTGEGAERMRADVLKAIEEAAVRSRVEARVIDSWSFGEPRFAPEMIALLEETASSLDQPWRRIRSQAGHDAYYLATVAPSAMIFTPCRAGVSHNVAEEIVLERTLPGANLLLNVLVRRANR